MKFSDFMVVISHYLCIDVLKPKVEKQKKYSVSIYLSKNCLKVVLLMKKPIFVRPESIELDDISNVCFHQCF